jgi:hypothetical protein
MQECSRELYDCIHHDQGSLSYDAAAVAVSVPGSCFLKALSPLSTPQETSRCKSWSLASVDSRFDAMEVVFGWKSWGFCRLDSNPAHNLSVVDSRNESPPIDRCWQGIVGTLHTIEPKVVAGKLRCVIANANSEHVYFNYINK